MFRCFRLPDDIDKLLDSNLKVDRIESEQKNISGDLINYYSDNIINGLSTTENYFPCENMDVFISHAHKDREVAYKLAAKLSNLGLTCFIDSTVWENVNDLIRQMDNKYAYNPEKKTYDYDTRNITTTHGHLMLSSALVQMIDRCECFFFLDTANSIYNQSDVVGVNGFNTGSLENEEGTFSPWIKLEIETARIIQKKIPARVIELRKLYESKGISLESYAMDHALEVFYPLSTKHLKEIEYTQLRKWFMSNELGEKCLDELYKIVKV